MGEPNSSTINLWAKVLLLKMLIKELPILTVVVGINNNSIRVVLLLFKIKLI